MADEDIARFRRAFDAWSRGDVEAALGEVAPDFELRDHVIPEGTEGPIGPEAVKANHAQLLAGFDEFTIEPLEFEEIESGMLVRVRATGWTDREGGIEVALEAGQLWRLRDGLAVSLDIYRSWEEARRAAGLEPAG
jgi:ketosteroid isomerase-like protein